MPTGCDASTDIFPAFSLGLSQCLKPRHITVQLNEVSVLLVIVKPAGSGAEGFGDFEAKPHCAIDVVKVGHASATSWDWDFGRDRHSDDRDFGCGGRL